MIICGIQGDRKKKSIEQWQNLDLDDKIRWLRKKGKDESEW